MAVDDEMQSKVTLDIIVPDCLLNDFFFFIVCV